MVRVFPGEALVLATVTPNRAQRAHGGYEKYLCA